MKKVLTFGVYDLLHRGHIVLFEKARALGDRLIVAVQDGDTVLKYKPEAKMINTTEERLYMVSAIRFVDEVELYRDVDKDIAGFDFDILVLGGDQVHDGFKRAEQWCRDNGKEVVRFPRTEGISSTMLRVSHESLI